MHQGAPAHVDAKHQEWLLRQHDSEYIAARLAALQEHARTVHQEMAAKAEGLRQALGNATAAMVRGLCMQMLVLLRSGCCPAGLLCWRLLAAVGVCASHPVQVTAGVLLPGGRLAWPAQVALISRVVHVFGFLSACLSYPQAPGAAGPNPAATDAAAGGTHDVRQVAGAAGAAGGTPPLGSPEQRATAKAIQDELWMIEHRWGGGGTHMPLPIGWVGAEPSSALAQGCYLQLLSMHRVLSISSCQVTDACPPALQDPDR